MNKLRSGWFACLALLVGGALRAPAVEFQFAGTVGNSGGEGAALVHTTFGRQGGGVVVDKKGRIYTGGGDRIVVLNKNGRQLWDILPPDKDFVIGFTSFAVAGDYLYFLAGKPVPWEKRYYQANYTMVEPNLCRTRMEPSAVAEIVTPATAFVGYTKMDISLTSDIRNGQIFIGYTTIWDVPGEFTVFRVKGSTLEKVFTVAATNGGLSCDEEGNFYVGGYVEGAMGTNGRIWKFDPTGKPLPGPWPATYPNLIVTGTFFTGKPMLTHDALWEMGGNGFLARYTRDFQPAPGVVASHLMPLFQTTQVADAPDGNYYVKSPDALYLAALQGDKIKLLHRLGAVPPPNDLALTPQGYIGFGDENLMFWYNFDNGDPAAPPANAQYFGPTARGFADGNGWDSVSRNLPLDYNPPPTQARLIQFMPEPLVGNSVFTGLQSGEFKSRIYEMARVGSSIYAIAGDARQLMVADEQHPFNLQPVALEDGQGYESICALGDSTLLLTNKNKLTAYQLNDGGKPKVLWSLGEAGAGDSFGNELHVAADGNQILLSDSLHQRVLLFGLTPPNSTPSLLASYGEKDVVGTEDDHFNHPTLVALRNGRAAIYDAENQRIVKLRLR